MGVCAGVAGLDAGVASALPSTALLSQSVLESRISLAARSRTAGGVLGSVTRVRMASIAISARAASVEFSCFIFIIRKAWRLASPDGG